MRAKYGCQPFISWVGGKRLAINELINRAPIKYGRYFEPFLGGGAMFYAMNPNKPELSDANADLIHSYKCVRDDVDGIIKHLEAVKKNDTEHYFFQLRDSFPFLPNDTKKGALFIYLISRCFGSAIRLNKNGKISSTYKGEREGAFIADTGNLIRCSHRLKGVPIVCRDFTKTPTRAGAFYYLDPPYHKAREALYSSDKFGDKGQIKLANFCKDIDKKGGYFLLSNYPTDLIKDLYKNYIIEELMVGGNFGKGKAFHDPVGNIKRAEVMIRNYTLNRQEDLI